MIVSMTQLPLLFFLLFCGRPIPFKSLKSQMVKQYKILSSIFRVLRKLPIQMFSCHQHKHTGLWNVSALSVKTKRKNRKVKSEKKNKRWNIIFKTVYDTASFNNVNDLQEVHEHLQLDSYRRITLFWLTQRTDRMSGNWCFSSIGYIIDN